MFTDQNMQKRDPFHWCISVPHLWLMELSFPGVLGVLAFIPLFHGFGAGARSGGGSLGMGVRPFTSSHVNGRW